MRNATFAGRRNRPPPPPPSAAQQQERRQSKSGPEMAIPGAHLPSFLLPESRQRREAQLRAALRPNRLLSYQRTTSGAAATAWNGRRRSSRQPRRPNSAANVRDFQRRRRHCDMQTIGDGTATKQAGASPRSGIRDVPAAPAGSVTFEKHRSIIELSVGIDQLLRKPEGQGEETKVTATLSACLAALASNLIFRKQSDSLSLEASAEVAKLLVRIRTGYDAEFLKQRQRVRALEEQVQQLKATGFDAEYLKLRQHVAALEEELQRIKHRQEGGAYEERGNDGRVDPVALLRHEYEKKKLKPESRLEEEKDVVSSSDGLEGFEISGSSRFLLEGSVSEFNAWLVPAENIFDKRNEAQDGQEPLLHQNSKLVDSDTWMSSRQNRQFVSLGIQTEVNVPKSAMGSVPTDEVLLIEKKAAATSPLRKTLPIQNIKVSEQGTQVRVETKDQSTQSVIRLTRGRACQTDPVNQATPFPSENTPAKSEVLDQHVTSYAKGKAKTKVKMKAKTKAKDKSRRLKAVEQDFDPGEATCRLLDLTDEDCATDNFSMRPWTPADTSQSVLNSSQVWDVGESAPQGSIKTVQSQPLSGICSPPTKTNTQQQQQQQQQPQQQQQQQQKQMQSRGECLMMTHPTADPGVLFGKFLSLTNAPVQTRLFTKIQSRDIRSQPQSQVREQDLQKVVLYIRDLFDAAVDNFALTMQTLTKFGLPDIVEADFVRRFGIRKLVDQKISDLLVNVAHHRHASQEVEYFAQLLEERLRPRSEFCFMLEVRRAAKTSKVGLMLSPPYGRGTEVLDLERAIDVSLGVLRRLPGSSMASENEVLSQIHALAGSKSPLVGRKAQQHTQSSVADTEPTLRRINFVDVLDILAAWVRSIQTRKAVEHWSVVAFESADENMDGFLSFDQFQRLFERLHPPPSRRVIEIAFRSSVSKSFSKHISREQFIGAATRILRSMPTSQTSANAQPMTTVMNLEHALPDLSQAVPIWRPEDESLEAVHLRNRWARRLTVAEKRFCSTQVGVAQTVLAIVTEQWGKVAPSVDAYHQMLYHAEDRSGVETAKALSRARTELEAAQSGHVIVNAISEMEMKPDADVLSTATRYFNCNQGSPRGMIHRAHAALFWFRKILSLVSNHQAELRFRLRMSGCNVSGLKAELQSFANIIVARWTRPGWLSGSAENTARCLLGSFSDARRKELLSRLGSRDHDWLCSPADVNGGIFLGELEDLSVGEKDQSVYLQYKLASRHDLRLLFLDSGL